MNDEFNDSSSSSPTSTNRLLLQPEEAGLWDLILLLWSSDVQSRKFVDCSDERQQDNNPGWLIFTSVVFQKFFLRSKGTMERVGRGLEMWLNLLAANGGFLKLMFKILVKKVKWPERSSAEFRSLIGNLDLRVEMEKNIRPGHRRYKAVLSLMAAKLSYENDAFAKSVVEDRWNMEFKGFYNFWNEYQGEASTQAIAFKDTKSNSNLTIVAFRGTSPFDAAAWCTDLDLSWYQIQGVGKIHRGFMKALGLQKNGWPMELPPPPHGNDAVEHHPYAYYAIRDMLREELRKNADSKFIVTGHSLGGALAILFVAILAMHGEAELLQRLEGVYTYGQPRVGDEEFGEFMKGKLKEYDVKYLRFVYANDVVPRLPYDDKTLFYKHFGPTLFYNSCYKVKVMEEEPNKNYFGVLWVVPKVLNAVWELLRSFIGPCMRGNEFRETGLMRVFRVIGLMLPGLADHCPQDYDNCTRFGSWPNSLQPPPKHHHGYSDDDEKLIHHD
ncbi:Triacylglycerol lipase OBL1 [Linum perenne]